jgi:hypothetical protein
LLLPQTEERGKLGRASAVYIRGSQPSITVKPVYNGNPWNPKNVAVVQRCPVFEGFTIEIGIKISLAGLFLAVVDRWQLFRGGR